MKVKGMKEKEIKSPKQLKSPQKIKKKYKKKEKKENFHEIYKRKL